MPAAACFCRTLNPPSARYSIYLGAPLSNSYLSPAIFDMTKPLEWLIIFFR